MRPIVTPAEMQAIDNEAPEPVEVLIDRAGRAVAAEAKRILGGVYGRRVTVMAGPGNNGADALVAGEVLARAGVKVAFWRPGDGDLSSCDLVIDGAFGTGISRPFVAPARPASAHVLAVDIPSGVDGLTGAKVGEPLPADHTVTFAALKPGLLLHPGAGLAGQLHLVDIGLDATGASAHLLDANSVDELVPPRAATDHKWKRAVWVIGGSEGMTGAPILAAKGALRAGAGYVRCSLPGVISTPGGSEVVFTTMSDCGWHGAVLDEADRFGALVIGCGIGRSADTATEIGALVDRSSASTPVVVDGDALRLLGSAPRLRSNVVLTPHDGEFEALTGTRPGADRFESVRVLARSTGATVLLKGPLTIVASPDGRCLAANRGDQRLATAGSGDVLAGVIGAFLAGGVDPLEAAAAAAWVHGDAALRGPSVGMVASDLHAGVASSLSDLHAGVASSLSDLHAGVASSLSDLHAGVASSLSDLHAGVASSLSDLDRRDPGGSHATD